MEIPDLPRQTRRMFGGGDMLAVEMVERLPAWGRAVHESFAIALILRGEGRYHELGGGQHRLAPGTIFLHLPGVRHRISRHRAGEWRQLVLRTSRATWVALSLFGPPCPTPPVWAAGPAAQPALVQLQATLSDERLPGWLVLARTAETLQALFPACGSVWEQAATILAGDRHARVDLPTLAAGLGLSYSHFRRGFRQHHGASPDVWRRRARLAEADRLQAAENGLTLRQVAASTGWASATALTRARRSTR